MKHLQVMHITTTLTQTILALELKPDSKAASYSQKCAKFGYIQFLGAKAPLGTASVSE